MYSDVQGRMAGTRTRRVGVISVFKQGTAVFGGVMRLLHLGTTVSSRRSVHSAAKAASAHGHDCYGADMASSWRIADPGGPGILQAP